MVNLKGKPVELRVPSRMGYEKVAMGTAASVAKLMGFPDDRIEDLKTAIAHGSVTASFTCEAFSTQRLERVTAEDVQSRLVELQAYTTFKA